MDKLSNEEVLKVLQALTLTVMNVERVDSCNFNPHPYTITSKHLEYSTGIYLDIEDAERKGAKCGVKGCNLSYRQHTYEIAAFLRPARDVISEAKAQGKWSDDAFADMQKLKQAVEDGNLGVSGFAFLEPKGV